MGHKEATGELTMRIARRDDGVSFAREQFHRGALRVIRPHYLDSSGQVSYTVINPGGAFFGGDRYQLDLRVDDGADLLLLTQSASKVYQTPQGPALQEMRVEVGPHARFEYLPDPLIVYRDGEYHQNTQVTVHPTSTVVLSEVVTPGWSPTGEKFRFTGLRMRQEIGVITTQGIVPFVVDQIRVVPSELTKQGMGFMEGFSHTGQLILVDPRITEEFVDTLHQLITETEAENSTYSGITLAGREIPASDVDGHPPRCIAVRTLGHSSGAITKLQRILVNEFHSTVLNKPALNLRSH